MAEIKPVGWIKISKDKYEIIEDDISNTNYSIK